jgi:ATP-dependent helicase/nuclease subunit A
MAELEGGVTVELVERVPRRPTGKAFGILVHEVLATTELDADEEHIRARAKALGRVLGNSEEEIAAASEATLRALAHPLLRRAASASRKEGLCHRESPIMLQTKDGSLVEGVMDLAFREGSQWTVVDFKTDIRIDIGQEVYRRQVALYTQALARASGMEARGVLLYV